jgi:hypothetical protein
MDKAISWRQALIEGIYSGTVASVISTAALTLCGWLERRRPAAPNNGPSQWVWGEREAYETKFTVRHTVTGYAVHHVMSIFWATLHQKAFGGTLRQPALPVSVTQGLVTAAFAAFVDYRLTPRRLQPGFDKHLGAGSIAAVYTAFGLGLALAAHRRGLTRRSSNV